ncbi:hypothetical protein RF55_16135, partial [Lasius niger]
MRGGWRKGKGGVGEEVLGGGEEKGIEGREGLSGWEEERRDYFREREFDLGEVERGREKEEFGWERVEGIEKVKQRE